MYVCQPEYVRMIATAHKYVHIILEPESLKYHENYVMYVCVYCFTLNVSFVGMPFETLKNLCGCQSSWVDEVYLYMMESHDDIYYSNIDTVSVTIICTRGLLIKHACKITRQCYNKRLQKRNKL